MGMNPRLQQFLIDICVEAVRQVCQDEENPYRDSDKFALGVLALLEALLGNESGQNDEKLAGLRKLLEKLNIVLAERPGHPLPERGSPLWNRCVAIVKGWIVIGGRNQESHVNRGHWRITALLRDLFGSAHRFGHDSEGQEPERPVLPETALGDLLAVLQNSEIEKISQNGSEDASAIGRFRDDAFWTAMMVLECPESKANSPYRRHDQPTRRAALAVFDLLWPFLEPRIRAYLCSKNVLNVDRQGNRTNYQEIVMSYLLSWSREYRGPDGKPREVKEFAADLKMPVSTFSNRRRRILERLWEQRDGDRDGESDDMGADRGDGDNEPNDDTGNSSDSA